MKNKSKSIFIGILNQGEVRVELAALMAELPKQRSYNLFISYPAHKPITHNRNMIVKKFLETDYDYLLMIDSDCIPPANVLDLADYQKDIIGGLCFAYMDRRVIPLILKENHEGSYDMVDVGLGQGVIECGGIGSGVMMIKREVLENIPFPFRNEYDPEGIKIKGLDISFCERAKEKGYKVWCDVNMLCDHWTVQNLKHIWLTFNTLRKEALKKKKDDKKTIPKTK